MKMKLFIFSIVLITGDVFAQEPLQPNILGELNLSSRVEKVKEYHGEVRDLKILAPTLAPEEIDRAVLNKLMQEIADNPKITEERLGVSSEQIDDIFITISNAKSFINNNEMANVRAMCNAWNSSNFRDDKRTQEAIDAYKTRDQFTKNFVAKYYRLVLFDIESLLQPSEQERFNAYMNDRRRRMATSGARSWGSVVENIKSGRDAVNFHCRVNKDK